MTNVLFIGKLDVFLSSITYNVNSSSLINFPEFLMLLMLTILEFFVKVNLFVKSQCIRVLSLPVASKAYIEIYSLFVALTLMETVCR